MKEIWVPTSMLLKYKAHMYDSHYWSSKNLIDWKENHDNLMKWKNSCKELAKQNNNHSEMLIFIIMKGIVKIRLIGQLPKENSFA